VLPDGGRRIVVAESARAVRDRVWAGLRRQALWFLGAAALLLGTTNAVIRYAVLHPLKRIGRAVRQLERGQLGIEVAAPGADELGTLARNFNAMSRALAAHAESTRRELMAAHEVQAQMLPPPCVTFGGLTVGSRSAPRGMVGGDVCDVQPLPGGRVGLLVADLAGHDVAAALHTAMLRAFAWQDAKEAVTPGELLGRLNERLLANLPEGRFATAFFAVYDPHRGVLSWANGGHPPALLWRDGDVPQELEPTGTILGIIPGLVFGECEAEMPVGSRLAVFSDGLTEARDPGGQLWGSDGIARVLAAPDLTPTERVGRILEEAARFRDGAAPEDDLTVIIAHVGDQAARREDCGDLTGVSPGRYDAATHLGGAEISPGGTVGR
jgi:sigma-B regulation protein RsbU (phosphoserine phosphatase)